jgi:hypothetical protein
MEFCSVALVIVLTGHIIRECLPSGPKTKIANPMSSGESKDQRNSGLLAEQTFLIK